MTDGRPWWERHRAVLDEEEGDLAALADGEVTLDEELLERARVRTYRFAYSWEDETYDLEVTFADHHPYFPPKVTASQQLQSHQHPFNRQLCLLLGDTWFWDVSETVAELIRQQLPLLVADVADGVAPDEPGVQSQGPGAHVEPYVGYYTYQPDTSVRIGDTTGALDGVDGGTLTLALDGLGAPGVLRGVVLEIQDAGGAAQWSAPDELSRMYADHPHLSGRWARLPERPPADGPDGLLKAVGDEDPLVYSPREIQLGDGSQLDVVGAVFEDSVRPYERGDAWVFLVRGHGPVSNPQRSSGRGSRGGGRVTPRRPPVGPYLARAHRADRRSMTERTPSLAALADKHVVVFGTGGVGAPAAIELAKAGVGELTMVECDTVEPGNAPRWPLGFNSAGILKNHALGNFIHSNWPYTTVRVCPGKIGEPRVTGEGEPEWEATSTLLKSADLVFDATAEIGMSHFLSDLTRERGLPLVIASTTEGGWGGRIIHLGCGHDDPCWVCIRLHTEDGTLPVPPADPDPATGNVHPGGCTTATFTATGFDVATVSLAAVRLTAAILTDGAPDGYPPADWNVAIYSFRDATNALPGAADGHPMHRHPGCESCSRRTSG